MQAEIESVKGIAVFDVCDTIYYSNTTHDFIRFVFGKRRFSLKKLFYYLLNSKLSPLKYFLIALSVGFGWDLLKKINVYFLKGMGTDQLELLSEQFVAEFLRSRIIRQTNDLMAKFRKEGFRIVLCSASIEPVVAAVARATNTSTFVSTTLRYEGPVFSGKILEDIAGGKLAALRNLGLASDISYAVSDNVSDLDLLTAATNAIVVVHDKKRRNYWKHYPFTTIDLSL